MRSIFTILATGIFVASGLAATPAAADDHFARGASLYSANCGRCHNPRGPGEFSDGHWPLIMAHMRTVARIPGAQAREVQAFLLASNNPPARAVSLRTAPGLSGEQLLGQFGCRGCHQIGGTGGTIGPSLEGLFDRRSEAWVRDQIQHPQAHNPRTVMPELGLSNAEARAIVEALQRME